MSLLLCQVCKITRNLYLFFIAKNDALNSRFRFSASLKVSVFSRDNGLKAIENLMEKKGKFDYILLETTGLADPGMTHFAEMK